MDTCEKQGQRSPRHDQETVEKNGFHVTVSEVCAEVPSEDSSSPPESADGLPLPSSLKVKRPSLSLPILRVEQLKEEGCSSPGSSTYNSEDSEYSDTDIINRLGEFVPPNDDLAAKIAEQVGAGIT